MNLQALECSKDWPQTWEQVFVSVNSDVEARWPFTVTMICPKNRDFVSVWVEPVKLTQVENFFHFWGSFYFPPFLTQLTLHFYFSSVCFAFQDLKSFSRLLILASSVFFFKYRKIVLLWKSHTNLKQSLRFVKNCCYKNW